MMEKKVETRESNLNGTMKSKCVSGHIKLEHSVSPSRILVTKVIASGSNRPYRNIFLTIFFIITTITSVTILVWRELQRQEPEDESLTAETLKRAFPGYFHTKEEQEKLEQSLPPPKRVENTFNNTIAMCGCFIEGRRKRTANTNTLLHGCCKTQISFDAPTKKTNSKGVERRFVQLPNALQFYNKQTCSEAEECSGCQCMVETTLNTAVVFKGSKTYSTKSKLKDVEIDSFYFDGCCKCVNT